MRRYASWWLRRELSWRARPTLPPMDAALRQQAEFAIDFLHRSALEISATMRKHQLKLADRQCRMVELSRRIQMAVVILCTCLYAGRQSDERIRRAGEIHAAQLSDTLQGRRPSDAFLRRITALGADLVDQGLPGSGEILTPPILMPYQT